MKTASRSERVYRNETRFFLVVAATVIVFVGFGVPWLASGVHVDRDIGLRQANLRSVAGYVMAFSDETEDGRFPLPEQYSEILLRQFEIVPEPLFGDEDTQDLIWIVPFPWPDRRIPDDITQEELARTPLLHERVGLNPDGTSVAFWDGSVRFLTNEEFESIIDAELSVCLACEFAMPELMKSREP